MSALHKTVRGKQEDNPSCACHHANGWLKQVEAGLNAHLVNPAISTFSKFLVEVVPFDHVVKLGTWQAVLTFVARG